jgi:hypothetical protein
MMAGITLFLIAAFLTWFLRGWIAPHPPDGGAGWLN